MSLIEPLRHNPRVRRDLDKYLRSVPGKAQLLKWAEQQRAFDDPVLIVWARRELLTYRPDLKPGSHSVRLGRSHRVVYTATSGVARVTAVRPRRDAYR